MSFRLKTILGIAIIEGVLLMLLVYTSIDYLKSSNESEIEKRAQSTASLFAAAAKDAVLSTDLSTLNNLANELISTNQVLYVNVFNRDDLLVTAGANSGVHLAARDSNVTTVDDGILDIEAMVAESGIVYGRVELGVEISKLDIFIADATKQFLLIAALEMVLVALFSWLLGHYLTRNLLQLKSASTRVFSGEKQVKVPVTSQDEIGQAAHAFNQMVEQIDIKTHALENANTRLSTILGTALDGYIIINTHGEISEVNPAVSRLFGYKDSELLGQNVSLLLPLAERGMHDVYIRKYLDSGESKIIGKGRELMAQHKEGELFPIELSISKMILDGELLFLGLVKDLSDVKRAQVAAQRTESILLATLEGSKDGLITIDITGEIQEVNDSACLMFQAHSSALVGERMETCLFQGGARATFREILEEYRLTGAGKAFKNATEIFATRFDGKLLPIELTLIPVQLGEEMLLTAFIRDISRRMEYETQLKLAKEQAEQGSKAKSRFLATMSHEIRSPLNAVLGSVDLLLDSRLNKEQRIYANTAKEAGTALLSTINDILDFSKIEAGQMLLEKSSFSAAKLVTQVLQILSPKAQDKGITLASFVNCNVPESLIGDGQRLRQVLQNLVDNAIKFSSGGCIAVEMWLLESQQGKAQLCCTVTDQGIGISEEAQLTLFKEFSQVHDEHNTNYSGTGLGLAICAELITRMEGSIAVRSEQGRGSCFSFDVKLELEEAELSMPRQMPTDARVLLVHHNSTYCRLFEKQYRQYGVSAICVDGVKSIFNNVNVQGRFSLVLIDEHSLVELTELQAQKIKQSYLNEEGLMAALMTVVVPEASKLLAKVGLEQVVNKPLSRDMMLAMLSGEHRFSHDVAAIEEGLSNENRQLLPILLAEDSPANQIVASALLNKAGFSVEIANNGKEAVTMAAKKEYGLILMDMRMPEMDGVEATEHILLNNPQQIIIAMTANVQKEDVDLCMNAGMRDFVPKPVNRAQLIKAVNYWMAEAKTIAKESGDSFLEVKEEAQSILNTSKAIIGETVVLSSPVTSTINTEPDKISSQAGEINVIEKNELGQQAINSTDDDPSNNILDEATLIELSSMLGEDAMARMFSVFLNEAEERLTVLKSLLNAYDSLGNCDLDEVDIQAHTLKSSAGSFGAQALSVAAKSLEQSAKAGDVSQLSQLLNNVIDIGEQTLQVFKARLT
ncbi:PAS domain protein [Shewanella piezotolerans WP3]|uniref:Sensor protein FixL n=1 Tax=Shewanella piezotolerans (strain WP3 / JCM 13877) TaxID=225849 RepID=B8CL71_SHEPW|nr:PAS domain S-box protein [Shewanella piezotolerans]ACJ28397.1 PAS domain protein [Shewanella piezotolerans WP3]